MANSPLDLDAMEAVAKAATKGLWIEVGPNLSGSILALIPKSDANGTVVPRWTKLGLSDFKHFATFGPPTVLRLIQTQRELVGALELARNGLNAASVIGLFVPADKGGPGRQRAVDQARETVDAALQSATPLGSERVAPEDGQDPSTQTEKGPAQ